MMGPVEIKLDPVSPLLLEVVMNAAMVFDDVRSHTGWKQHKVVEWFTTANPYLGGAIPIEFLIHRPHKAKKIIDALIEEGKGP